MNSTRAIVGIIGRLVFWAGLVFILIHAVMESYRAGDFLMLVLKAIFFPITFLIYPWTAGLWYIFIISVVGYWISTFIGRMEPVD